MGRNRGGTKVPGVKLRPADPTNAKGKKNVVVSDDDDDDVVPPTPPRANAGLFRGVFLCATGIKNKREVFELVKRMGGTHTTDFTDMTTHLLAEGPGSEKYKCAIERGVPVLSTSWVYEAHQRWIAGEIFSLEETVPLHRLLPFKGVRICVTGIDTADVRARIHKLAKAGGGDYLKNLDKTCTHLLCAVHTSEKITWANKQNRDRENERARGLPDVPEPVKIVWEEWFWDCAYLQGLLDTDPYHISNERPVPMSASIMESPETYISSLPLQPSSTLPPPLPLATLLSDAGDTIAQVKVKKDAAAKEWKAIVKRQGYTMVNGEMRNISLHQTSSYSMETEESVTQATSPMKKTWAAKQAEPMAPKGWSRRSPSKKTAAVGRNDPLASPAKPIPIQLPKDGSREAVEQVSFLGKISKSKTIAFDDEQAPLEESGKVSTSEEKARERKSLFKGISFCPLGEADSTAVRSSIVDRGGSIIAEGIPDYYIVRLVGGSDIVLSHPTEVHSKFRTECWLERCLFEGRLCETKENITYIPLRVVNYPTDKMNVAVSGLDSSERIWVSRLFRLLGVELSSNFSVQCTHLLCPSQEGIKCKKAAEWKIPVVGFEWLNELALKATSADNTRTPGRKAQTLPMEKSLEALEIDTQSPKKRPANIEESLQQKLAKSPIFHVPSPINFGDQRPPSPKSPSPNRKRTMQLKKGISEATNLELPPDLRYTAQELPSGEIKSDIRTPGRPQVTQRVPSSASPSPLKTTQGLPKSSGNASSYSALHFPSAKSLGKNIAILGTKRPAEDDMDGASSTTSGTESNARKRPRRPQSNMSKALNGTTPKKLTLAPMDPTFGDDRELYNDDGSGMSFSLGETPTEQSSGIAVNYTDPNEEAERKRLLMLIKGTADNAEDATQTDADLNHKSKRPVKTLQPRRSGRHKANQV